MKWGERLRKTAFADAVLDISSPDGYLIQRNGPQPVQLGGTFLGVVIPNEIAYIQDGARFRVRLGEIPSPLAMQVGKMWSDTMIQRVHGALNAIRLHTRPLRPTPDGYEEI